MAKVDLKEHLNSRIDEVKDSVQTAYASMEKRLETSYNSMEKRLESMNEFRDQLKNQAATFVTRRELWAALVVAVSIIVSILIYFK